MAALTMGSAARHVAAFRPGLGAGSLGLAAMLVISTADGPAAADVSSFAAVGGGATGQIAQGATTPDMAGALTYSIGVGTSPLRSFVFGVMYRGATYFNLGTDVGTTLRLASGGFCRGDWGFAVDAGALYRTWGGGNYGTWPLQALLTAGSPWGLQLSVGAQFWDVSGASPAKGVYAALEIDLLRLTVTRQGPTERWWPNPNPAGGHEPKTAALSF